MRIIFAALLFFLLVTLCPPVNAEWKRIETGTLAWLRAISFADRDIGWVGGSAGTLLKTNDGGLTWKKHESPTGDTIRDIHFADSLNGWMLCERDIFGRDGDSPSYVLTTSDGGETWERVEVETGRERMLRLVAGHDGRVKYAVGEMGTILILTEALARFSRTRLSTRAMLTSGRMLDEKRGSMVGGAGTILITEDGGSTWDTVLLSGQNGTGKLNAVIFLEGRLGWAAGNSGTILHTRNSGKKWDKQISGTGKNLNDIFFRDADNGTAVGDEGTIVSTDDGGNSWKIEFSGTKHKLERIAFQNERLFAIGFGGTLYSAYLPAR